MNDYLTASDIAAKFGVTPDTISRWVAAGMFPESTHRAGSRRLWAREAVEGLPRPRSQSPVVPAGVNRALSPCRGACRG